MTDRLPARSVFVLLTLAFALFAAPAVRAELPPVPEDPPTFEMPRVPDRFLLVSIEGSVGVQPSDAMKQVYENRLPFSGSARFAYLFGERFGVGAGVGFQLRTGTGIAPADETPPEVWLWQVPIEVEGSMRLLVWRSQPVVPYLRGGVNAVIWEETWPGPTGEKESMMGVKWGVHVGGGAQFRLPFPEINMRNRRIGDPLLDDIWLHLEGWARSADNFGAGGLDLSAAGASVGITLLM